MNGKYLTNWLPNPHSLIAVTPPAEWRFMEVYAGLIGLLLIAGIAVGLSKLHPNLKARISELCWTNVILGAFLFFFREQQIPVLGMDIWRLLQEIGLIVWIGVIAFYRQTRHTKVLLKEQVELRKKKYLPGTR